jgi:hypothetical protein
MAEMMQGEDEPPMQTKNPSFADGFFVWLIRLIMIQGTVAPGWVQERVHCTLWNRTGRHYYGI